MKTPWSAAPCCRFEVSGKYPIFEIGNLLTAKAASDLTELVTTFFTGYSEFNREDLEDRKEDIFVGFARIVHSRSRATSSLSISRYLIARQLNELIVFLCGLRGLRGS